MKNTIYIFFSLLCFTHTALAQTGINRPGSNTITAGGAVNNSTVNSSTLTGTTTNSGTLTGGAITSAALNTSTFTNGAITGSTGINTSGAITTTGIITGSDYVDGVNSKLVGVGGSFPSITQGKLFYYNSFLNVPNTNNAFVFQPGLFLADGTSRFTPMTLDNRTAFYLISFIGDSWTFGSGLANANQGFVNKVYNYRGWAGTNYGVSGQTINLYRGLQNSGGVNAFIELGINDMRLYGATAIPSYKNLMQGLLVARGTNFVTGQSLTRNTTDWIAANVSFNTTTAIKTNVNSSPASFSATGDVVYINMAYESAGDATYTVTIDGVSKGTFTASGNTAVPGYPSNSGSDDSNYYPYLHRFTGLGLGNHNVVITRTGGTTYLRIISVGSNGNLPLQFGNNGIHSYVLSVGRMIPGVSGSSGYAFWGGSDALVAQYNTSLFDAVNELASDGLQVDYIDFNKYYDPNVAADVQADGLHPTDTGHTKIAKAILEATSLINNREKMVLRRLGNTIDVTSNKVQFNKSITATSALATGVAVNNTLVASANNDVLVGVDINPTFTNGAFTGVTNVGLRSTSGLFTGNVTAAHHIGSGTTPSIAAGAGAGTGPTISVTKGNDFSHQVSVLTGTTPTATSTIATITFATAFTSSDPNINIFPANAAAAGVSTTVFAKGASTTTYIISGTLSAATTYLWNVKATE